MIRIEPEALKTRTSRRSAPRNAARDGTPPTLPSATTPTAAAEAPHSVATALRCPKPMRMSRWWMWLRSADITERPSMKRRSMAKDVSRIGIPSATMGTEKPDRVVALEATRAAADASRKPMARLPASPRNTRAGWRLWGRKPATAPMRVSISRAAPCSPPWEAVHAIAPQAMIASPLARLSSPSMMLKALVAPTIHSTVRGTPNTPKSSRRSAVIQSPSMETPERTTRPAAPTWTSSLDRAPMRRMSSLSPTANMNSAPSRTASSRRSRVTSVSDTSGSHGPTRSASSTAPSTAAPPR